MRCGGFRSRKGINQSTHLDTNDEVKYRPTHQGQNGINAYNVFLVTHIRRVINLINLDSEYEKVEAWLKDAMEGERYRYHINLF